MDLAGQPEATIPRWHAASGLPAADVGDADKFGLAIDRLVLSSGDTIALPAGGVTAIVGANNSGKSTLLRQAHWHVTQPQNLQNERVRLVQEVSLSRSGSAADLLAWLDRHATFRDLPPAQGGPVFARPSASVQTGHAVQYWQQPPTALGPLAGFCFSYADAQSRLSQIGTVGQRGDVAEPPQHPLHQLQDDHALRDRLNAISQRIFRQSSTLDHLSGNMQLRVGTPSVAPPAATEGERAYRAALAELPPLQLQGDGMKSLLGLLLPLIAATFPVVIVDEPEAFLHPPQAQALGQALGELARDAGVQVLLATHDRNLLTGLLASEAPLSVVRLNRDGDRTGASQLMPEDLRDLWADPVLRYSNVLDGLFHQLVVVGEAERDCRFFQAALDAHLGDGTGTQTPATDVLFVPSNGKDGMQRLALALRAVAVPVAVSPDLDLLNDGEAVQRLVQALGGDWSAYEPDYKIATEPFRQPREQVRVADVEAALFRLFAEITAADADAPYTADTKRAVLAELRAKDSPWRALKDYGVLAFKGEAAAAASRLLSALDGVGIVLVRVGELEGFAPTLGVAKGKAWLPAALQAGAHRLPVAQEHVERLIQRVP